MKLYSAWYCPFAQRVWMSLLYKGIDFEYIEVDPYQKTSEWLELSKGTAQVPVIVVDSEVIVDSILIINQLDSMFPETVPIFSTNANMRIKQEKCIDHINNKIVPYFYRYLKSNIEGIEKDEAKQSLLYGISVFSEKIDHVGPYFSGGSVSVIDFLFFPFAYRINLLLKHYRDFNLPMFGTIWDKYHQWYEVMLKLPEFNETSISNADYDQRLIDVYYPYSQGGGQDDVTRILETAD
jgi:glutathione S-transferase